MITIRPAEEKDVPFITEIYNEAILNSTATFDTEIKSEEDRRQWLAAHDEQHPVLVAEQDGRVVGWASLSRWSDRCAYDSTAETSLYVHRDFRKRGIGKQLIEMIVLEAAKAGLHTLIARITHGNEQSVYLHERMGFTVIGTLREVGVKFGKYHDVHMLQKVY
ncbi:MAG: N-acetyltransferase [Bacteroidia bacterium]|nr:N-acetyltransferase [Bacteroidia bacterium]